MLEIRHADPADWPVIVEFNAAMAMETERLKLDRGCLSTGVRATLSDRAKGWYYLAVDDDVVVGQTMITLEWSDWRNGYWWWIQSVYVLPDWRRKGVFRALYETIAEEAKQAGNAVGLRLYVDRENHKAQETYVKLGMSASYYQFYEKAFH
ncbi:MAG: GNAT family N-acetyltransferase [Candidatus Omnitrophota bacterium]|jgi:GNAT superfamily N-acetyltransferase|nr:MAG: GNAT family N-acetyltransferase [Candidatus Omnitrophota bacterium]